MSQLIIIICSVAMLIIAIIGLIFYKEVKLFISSISLNPRKKKGISYYFDSKVPDDCHNIDIFFYQFGLRKTLPIMDWLYLEYIKFLNKTHQIKKLVIFPTIDLSVTCQLENDFNVFSENIKKYLRIQI